MTLPNFQMTLEQKLQREKELKQILTPDPNVNEAVLFNGLSVLFERKSDSILEKIGAGMVQILQNDLNKRCRILIRCAKDLNKALLNSYIYPFSEFQKYGDVGLQFNAINYVDNAEKKTYIINLVSKEIANDFSKKFLQSLAINHEIFRKNGQC